MADAWSGSKSRSIDAWSAGPSHVSPSGHSHHGILHNLVADAVNTAKGIPFGLVQTAEHPIRTTKAVGEYYKQTYGQGWGHFYKEFHAHPLQPLLDAISVPLILAGGAGLAIKGGSAVAELGRAAELGDVYSQAMLKANDLVKANKFAEADQVRLSVARHPGLAKQALRFKPGTTATTRLVPTGIEGLSLPKAYSTNLFRRMLTKGTDGVLEGFGNRVERGSYFSTSHLGERMRAKDLSKRGAASAGRVFGQVRVLRQARKLGLDHKDVAEQLGRNMERVHMENAHWVDAVHAKDIAKNPRFKEQYQFIAKQKKEDVLTAASQSDTYEELIKRMSGEGHGTSRVSIGPEMSDAQIKEFVKTLGERVTTTSSSKAAYINERGQVGIVRKGLGKQVENEIEGSMKLASAIYRAPLGVWKGMILGLAPRYFVNNVIGNAGMYMAATNPVEFTQGVLKGIKSARGIRAHARAQAQMESTLDGLMARYLPQEWISENMGFLQHGALGVDQTIGANVKGPIGRARHARLYGITEKLAYRGPQRASLMGALTRDADFRDLYRAYKARGLPSEIAFQRAAKDIVTNPLKQAAFEKKVTDWAGQYYHLNSLEHAITAFVPFYNWDRHALRFGKEQVLSRPVQTATLAQLGALGDKAANRELGKVPDFLKGAIPLKGYEGGVLGFMFGQHVAGRQKILLTAGYNPLAAAAEDANALASLVGAGQGTAGEAIGGQFNPLISGAIAGVTGVQLFSGAKTPPHHGGPIGEALNEAILKLPQVTTVKALLGKTPPTTTKAGKPTLYQKGIRQDLSSILGLNERDFSTSTARAMYKEEHRPPSRKKRRKAKAAVKALF